jgi:tRNA 2-thiouridine synthesizing protein E
MGLSVEVDGDGFLKEMTDWNEEVMHELAGNDNFSLNDEHIKYIMAAREMYEQDSMVPRIREFSKKFGMDRKAKALYDLFESGPMKRIAKYGGLPKPTGCV